MSNKANRANTPALQHVTAGLWGLRDVFANLYFVRDSDLPTDSWVLIDAGLPGSGEKIQRSAEALFGQNNPPAAILLTHGHFDHVGALGHLLTVWPNAPVYAHPLELPYLTGRSSYPPPDPTVGGAMSALSFLYPKKPINLGARVHKLPTDGTVPELPGWRWVHTPGHSPGHVSFFREHDHVLVAGDAFVTVEAESGFATWSQHQEVHGPPAYFTPDWQHSRHSVALLAGLAPSLAATGHGIPMEGEELRQQLAALVEHFDEKAVPVRGRYVGHPAIANENGVVSVPPPASTNLPVWLVGAGLAVVGGIWLSRNRDKVSGFKIRSKKEQAHSSSTIYRG